MVIGSLSEKHRIGSSKHFMTKQVDGLNQSLSILGQAKRLEK